MPWLPPHAPPGLPSPIDAYALTFAPQFHGVLHSGVCCTERGPKTRTGNSTTPSGHVNELTRSLFRHSFTKIAAAVECEKRCLADDECAFFSYSSRLRICLLCSGCAVTDAWSFKSWRRPNRHVVLPQAARAARSLVVIAALGALSPSYANTHALLATHFGDASRWDCTVYAYSPFGVPAAAGVDGEIGGGVGGTGGRGVGISGRVDGATSPGTKDQDAAVLLSAAAQYIASRCRVIECLGCSIGRIWRMTTPDVIAGQGYEYLFMIQVNRPLT